MDPLRRPASCSSDQYSTTAGQRDDRHAVVRPGDRHWSSRPRKFYNFRQPLQLFGVPISGSSDNREKIQREVQISQFLSGNKRQCRTKGRGEEWRMYFFPVLFFSSFFWGFFGNIPASTVRRVALCACISVWSDGDLQGEEAETNVRVVKDV